MNRRRRILSRELWPSDEIKSYILKLLSTCVCACVGTRLSEDLLQLLIYNSIANIVGRKLQNFRLCPHHLKALYPPLILSIRTVAEIDKEFHE